MFVCATQMTGESHMTVTIIPRAQTALLTLLLVSTPVCMPRGDNEPAKRRVCSKGCNQLLKVDKDFQGSVPPTTTDESLLYDMVVCQGNPN